MTIIIVSARYRFIYLLPLPISHLTYLDYISSYFSTHEEFLAFQNALKQPLQKTITLVQSKQNTDTTLENLVREGYSTTRSDYNPNNYKVYKILHDTDNQTAARESSALGNTKGHLLGHFYIQETAASLPALYVTIPREGHILDMCAAPGGKTIQLADRCKMEGSQAIIRANEPDNKRLQALESNITRCGLDNIILTQHNGEHFAHLTPETFDVILLDAPCSGEGTGFKSDFGTKFRDIHKIKQIAHLQYSLLESALKACKVGGQIMYSTCTINTIENEENILKLIEQYSDYIEIEELQGTNSSLLSHGIALTSPHSPIQTHDVKRLRPHIQHTGGFFMCKIKKLQSLETKTIEKKNPFKSKPKYTICNQERIKQRLIDTYDIRIDTSYIFTQFQNNIYLSHSSIAPFLPFINIYSPGLGVLKGEKEQDRRPIHNAGTLRDRNPTKQLRITDTQLIDHIHGKDFSLTPDQVYEGKQGFVQIIHNSLPIGIGKIIGNSIKNKFGN